MANKQMYLDLKIDVEMARGHIKYLKPYLDAIDRAAGNPDTPILEIGIGTGLCSIYLGQKGYKLVFGIDLEPEIVDKFNEETKPLFNSHVQVIAADAFDLHQIKKDLRFIKCIHHQGLLEHFSEDEIIKMLNHHTEISDDCVVFAVPLLGHVDESEYDPDEIRWSLDEWVKFLKEHYRFFEYGAFGFDHGHDQAYFIIGQKG